MLSPRDAALLLYPCRVEVEVPDKPAYHVQLLKPNAGKPCTVFRRFALAAGEEQAYRSVRTSPQMLMLEARLGWVIRAVHSRLLSTSGAKLQPARAVLAASPNMIILCPIFVDCCHPPADCHDSHNNCFI